MVEVHRRAELSVGADNNAPGFVVESENGDGQMNEFTSQQFRQLPGVERGEIDGTPLFRVDGAVGPSFDFDVGDNTFRLWPQFSLSNGLGGTVSAEAGYIDPNFQAGAGIANVGFTRIGPAFNASFILGESDLGFGIGADYLFGGGRFGGMRVASRNSDAGFYATEAIYIQNESNILSGVGRVDMLDLSARIIYKDFFVELQVTQHFDTQYRNALRLDHQGNQVVRGGHAIGTTAVGFEIGKEFEFDK